jgi:hypothetical protein
MSWHICRASDPETLTPSPRTLRQRRFATRCILTENQLEFDLDQDWSLPSAQQVQKRESSFVRTHDRSEEGAMRAFSLQRRHRSLPNVFAQSWRRWMATQADQLLETARLGSDNLEYLTHDLNAPDSDLCTVAGSHCDDLLRRRMLALDLDPYEIALWDPALLRHLKRRCALCQSREDCASDLARASTGQACQGRDDWRDYCENALALEMLIALRSRSKAAPKYQCPYIG